MHIIHVLLYAGKKMTWLRQEKTSLTTVILNQAAHKTTLPRYQISVAGSSLSFSGLLGTEYTIDYINSSDNAESYPIQMISFNTPGVSGGPSIVISLPKFANVSQLYEQCKSAGFKLIGRSICTVVINFKSSRADKSDTFDRFKELFDIICQFDQHANMLSDMIFSDVSRVTGFDFRPPASLVHSGSSSLQPSFFQARVISSKDEIPIDFLCPISQELMADPVTLSLDGRNYNRTNIVQWLNIHRNSPFNRVEIPFEKTIEEVLVPNLALAETIVEFKDSNPRVFNETAGPKAQ